jgi:signal transduction histidine kinase
MINLRVKLALFNLFSKLTFTVLFLIFLPYIIERINLRQVDNDLVQKREQVIEIIAGTGIEPFITSDSVNAFGSYNLLKEEFISIEIIAQEETLNYIEVTPRLIEGEEINYRVLNYTFMVDGKNYLLEIGKSLTSIMYSRKNITKVMFIFLAFIIIITFLTDIQYTRFILHPFGKIIARLREISDPSLFDKTPVKTTTSDFYQLDNALRSLMERIDELFRKEKEITVDISHELMTPISVLRSKLENMLLREDLDDDMQSGIEESLKTLHRLQSLVNSLLMIARIESRQYLMDETFSIGDVLKEIINEILPVADDKGISLNGEPAADISITGANKPLIFSMFYNIVNNAVKNTPSGGNVLVKSFFRQNRYYVTVSDTGKGMNEMQMKDLFLRFKARTDTGENGTGIGLAIAKTIADLHNIEVSVTSEIEKGTIFSFKFPENS